MCSWMGTKMRWKRSEGHSEGKGHSMFWKEPRGQRWSAPHGVRGPRQRPGPGSGSCHTSAGCLSPAADVLDQARGQDGAWVRW